ncbi:MAG: lysophospholipid acyltransferase family protein [Rhodobacteraceae bacterium]|nr:lysophospholipid acyltransferase family protein [Paracoccaceae bacterium]
MAQDTKFRTYQALKILEFSLRLVPYNYRIHLGGQIMQRMIAPRTGMKERVQENLKFIYPDMPEHQRDEVTGKVINNFGRFYFEFFSSKEFLRRSAHFKLSGEGLEEFRHAASQNKPIIIVSGHFGNYEAVRSHLQLQGFQLGGIYRPMANPYFNKLYTRTMKNYGKPVFPTTLEGTKEIVKFVQAGNILALLNDQYTQDGLEMPFLGAPAKTSPIFAKIALKYGALVIPSFGIRQTDGLDFEVVMERSIQHTDPVTMAIEFNERLGVHINNHIDQWFWIHRRWK